MRDLLIEIGFVDNGSNVYLMDENGFHYDVDLETNMIYKIRLFDYATIYVSNFSDLKTLVRALGGALGKEY